MDFLHFLQIRVDKILNSGIWRANLHVKVHRDLAAPIARDLAGKVYHNRAGDARHVPREE